MSRAPRWLRGACGGWLVLASGCTGLFQASRQHPPASYAVTAAAGSGLAVGCAEADATPPVGGYLAGFDLGRRSTAVASPLKVRAMVCLVGDRSFAIVGVDNLGLLREDVDWLKAGLAGFANGDVFVCASHTHAGPDLLGLWGPYLLASGRDRDYLAALRRAMATAVAAARAAARPARLLQGEARLPPAGLVKNANRAGCFDPRLTVLQAVGRDDGAPLGALLHLACHPEVLPRGNTAVSADFVGALCDRWRERGHGQAVFVNGALGAMISPAVQPRDQRGVTAFAEAAGAVAEAALAEATEVAVDAVEVRRRDVYVPVETLGFRLAQLTMALQRPLFDGAARSTVGWLRIGSFEALAVPGEVEPALAERIRAELQRPRLLLFGLCDDELGYLLRAQDAAAAGFAYERAVSACRLAGEIVRAAITGQ